MYFLGIPELRLSEAEKYKDNQKWFKTVMEYHVPMGSLGNFVTEASKKMIDNYRYLNNIFDYNEWSDVCDELGITEDNFNNNFFKVNIIPVIVNYLKSVELRRNDTYTPLLMTQQSLIQKDEELRNKVAQAVQGRILAVMMASQKYQTLLAEGQDDPKAQEEMQKLQQEYEAMYPIPKIEGYLSELEILGSKIVQYATYNNKVKYKKTKNETFEDVILNYGEIIRLTPTYDGIDIQRINLPYFLCHKSPDTEYVQDGSWASYTQMFTPYQLKLEFPEVKDEEWAKIGLVAHDVKMVTNDITTAHHDKYPEWEFQALNSGSLDWLNPDRGWGTGMLPNLHRERLIPVTHFEFVAFKEMGILKTTDQFGNEIVEIVDETFEEPKGVVENRMNNWGFESPILRFEGGTLEKLWIPRRYEITRIGLNFYTRMRECLYQTVNIDNPFQTQLSYFGKFYSHYNSQPISMFERLKPYNVFYNVIFNKFIKLVERWDGYLIPLDLDAIPVEFGHTSPDSAYDPDLAMEKFFKLRKDGYLIQKQFVEDGKLTRPSPAILNAEVGNTFRILIELLNWIKTEMGMIVGVSPQALSQMINNNVGDNQQALLQTSYMIDPIFQQHNWTWQEIMTGYVNNFIEWAKEKVENGGEHRLSYIFSENTKDTLLLKSENLDLAYYGVVISNSNPKEYYDVMMAHTQAMIQNQLITEVEISSMLLAMQSGESPYEIHKKFMKAKEDREARENQMQQIEQQKIQAQKEGAEAMIKVQKEMVDLKEQWEEVHLKTKGEFELRKEAMKVYQFQDTLDADANGVPDPIEAAKLQHTINMEQEKLNIDKAKAVTERRSQLFEEQKHADQLVENEKDRKITLQKNNNKAK